MSTPIQCELISWESVYRLAYRLAERILDAEYRPDLVVAIARGGYVPARLLCDFLHLYDLTSIRVEHYQAGAQKRRSAHLKFPLAAKAVNQRVLIVDDVCDSGETYQVALEHVASLGPCDIKTAALHYKQGASFEPDYIADELTRWRWLIYPWAVIEDIGQFIQQMENSSLPVDGIVRRLEVEHGIRISEQRALDIIHLTSSWSAEGRPGKGRNV
jgi:uncharacterized protein